MPVGQVLKKTNALVAIFLFEFQTSNGLEEKEKAGEIFVFVGKDQKKELA